VGFCCVGVWVLRLCWLSGFCGFGGVVIGYSCGCFSGVCMCSCVCLSFHDGLGYFKVVWCCLLDWLCGLCRCGAWCILLLCYLSVVWLVGW